MATTLLACAMTVACSVSTASAGPGIAKRGIEQVSVSGNGVHRFSESIEHSTTVTETGITILSTEVIDLFGDLNGQILYHPVTEIDFGNQVLVNTGHQVFSGTVAGSAPVLIYDDKFRFDVDLAKGQVRGEVYLDRSLAGPRMFCELKVEGPVAPPGQNSEFTYEGTCWGLGLKKDGGISSPAGNLPKN
ncbi:hypothetical protein DX908_03745 [Parvularcula marina]|uniref:Uncharacterized protein n=2 Tax=Parvularcula marina TaxID=2292771 RepID=A0A371RG73_9PROT|nr:hypothetical protein DX908_03745 [Parvularcula marina]